MFDLDPDPTGPTGVGMKMDVGEGLVDAGQHAGGFRLAETGVQGPFFGEEPKPVQAGWGQLDIERGFGGGGSRVHAGQSLGTGAGTGLSLLRIFSSDGSRGTGPPKISRWGLRATVAMKVLP